MSNELFKLFQKRDITFAKYKSCKSSSSLGKFRLLRNKSVGALRKAKCEFLMRLSSLIRSPKQFWSLYHSVTPNKQGIPPTLNNGTVTTESATSKANLLASHFTSCYSSASHSSSCVCNSLPTAVSDSGLSDVTTTTEEVCRLLSTVKIKTASGPDGIPAICFATLLQLLPPPSWIC